MVWTLSSRHLLVEPGPSPKASGSADESTLPNSERTLDTAAAVHSPGSTSLFDDVNLTQYDKNPTTTRAPYDRTSYVKTIEETYDFMPQDMQQDFKSLGRQCLRQSPKFKVSTLCSGTDVCIDVMEAGPIIASGCTVKAHQRSSFGTPSHKAIPNA